MTVSNEIIHRVLQGAQDNEQVMPPEDLKEFSGLDREQYGRSAESIPAIVCTRTAPLNGEVTISGSKNVGLKLLTTVPMFAEPISLHGVPKNNQVRYLLDLFRSFGLKTTIETENLSGFDMTVHAASLSRDQFDYHEIRRCRHTFLFAVSILMRAGRVTVPLPGYSHYGTRPIDGQLAGLRKMGVNIHPVKNGTIHMEVPPGGLKGIDIFLPFPSNAVTEALLWAAVAAEGTTTIHGAAQEPETVELGRFFRAAGVEIHGIGTPTLVIHGRGLSALRSPGAFRVMPDRIETATWGAGVALCGGEIRLKGVRDAHLSATRAILTNLGVEITNEGENTWFLRARGRSNATDITTGPFPGFPTDTLGPYLVVLSIANGVSVINERMWTNRLSLATELKRLGAQIDLPTGQVAVIRGVRELSGAPVIGTDPRATAALILAGLSAEGETIITGVDLLDNAYDAFDEKLHQLGAHISRTMVPAERYHHHHPIYGRLEAF